jgi:hypothetical protein
MSLVYWLQHNYGTVAFALSITLLISNILTMKYYNDENKIYYGMDISALVFLIIGIIGFLLK